ncbi:MAG TPA: hypothetical protein VI299_22990, partial [Polyangiales bacterium]
MWLNRVDTLRRCAARNFTAYELGAEIWRSAAIAASYPRFLSTTGSAVAIPCIGEHEPARQSCCERFIQQIESDSLFALEDELIGH